MIRWLAVLFTLSFLADAIANGYDDYLEDHPDASRSEYQRALERAQEGAAPSQSGSYTILNPATGDMSVVFPRDSQSVTIMDLRSGKVTPVFIYPR